MCRADRLSWPFPLIPMCLLAPSGVRMVSAAERFQRGDSNGDASFDLSDAVQTLGFLFLGTPETLSCLDAADSNDDGDVDITDPLHTLGYLFLGTPAPPSPFGACGEDPSTDDLTCESFEPCPGPPDPPVLETPVSPTRETAIELCAESRYKQ